jgi:hypothetical protein
MYWREVDRVDMVARKHSTGYIHVAFVQRRSLLEAQERASMLPLCSGCSHLFRFGEGEANSRLEAHNL